MAHLFVEVSRKYVFNYKCIVRDFFSRTRHGTRSKKTIMQTTAIPCRNIRYSATNSSRCRSSTCPTMSARSNTRVGRAARRLLSEKKHVVFLKLASNNVRRLPIRLHRSETKREIRSHRSETKRTYTYSSWDEQTHWYILISSLTSKPWSIETWHREVSQLRDWVPPAEYSNIKFS